MLIGNVRIVTSKMSCAQVRERESCVVALSETNTKEEAKELLDLCMDVNGLSHLIFDKSMCFYWLR
jgi:hypothetical protein